MQLHTFSQLSNHHLRLPPYFQLLKLNNESQVFVPNLFQFFNQYPNKATENLNETSKMNSIKIKFV